MSRLKLVVLLAIVAVAAPHAAFPQQRALPVISFLQCFGRPAQLYVTEEFQKGLGEMGYAEGTNVAIEGNWGEGGDYSKLPQLAAQLVRRKVAIIVAWGNPCAVAAKAATATIPVIFWSGIDPVAQGLVASLARPDGNLTGFADLSSSLGAKRVELLRELLPRAAAFAFLVNPTNPNAELQLNDVQEAARTEGVEMHIVRASTEDEVEAAFAALANKRAEGLIVAADPFFFSRYQDLIGLRRYIPWLLMRPRAD